MCYYNKNFSHKTTDECKHKKTFNNYKRHYFKTIIQYQQLIKLFDPSGKFLQNVDNYQKFHNDPQLASMLSHVSQLKNYINELDELQIKCDEYEKYKTKKNDCDKKFDDYKVVLNNFMTSF